MTKRTANTNEAENDVFSFDDITGLDTEFMEEPVTQAGPVEEKPIDYTKEPFEVFPGIVFDPTAPKPEYLQEGTTVDRIVDYFTTPDPRYRLKSEINRENETERLSKEIGGMYGTEGEFDYDGREVREIVGLSNLPTFGFMQTSDQALNSLEASLGEGNVRVFEDKNPRTIFSPRFYVSVKREDGSFTPFGSPTQEMLDYAAMLSGELAYEIAAGSAVAGASFATAAAVTAATSFTGPLAPFIGAITFATVAYNGSGAQEIFKQEVLKERLQLTDEEAAEAESYFEGVVRVVQESTPFIGEPFTFEERLAAGLGALGILSGGIVDKIGLMQARFGKRLVEEQVTGVFPTARPAAAAAKATKAKPGTPEAEIPIVVARGDDFIMPGTLDVTLTDKQGTQKVLGALGLQDISDSPIIKRLGNLATQTSVIIPRTIKRNIQSATDYLTTYSKNMGRGNFGQFRSDLKAMRDFYLKNRNRTPEFEALGIGIKQLDETFMALRFAEAQGLYNRVFTKVGKSSYDLTDLKSQIERIGRPVVPVREGIDEPISAAQLGMQAGEPRVYDTLDALREIATTKDGLITFNTMDAAIRKFNQANPGYALRRKDMENVDSPAKLLQMFAIRFGEMASDIKNLPTQTNATRDARSAAMEVRESLLNLIGNPADKKFGEADKKLLIEELGAANAFYKETADIAEAALTQSQLRMTETAVNPGQLARNILLKPEELDRAGTLQAIAQQQAYVRNALDGTPQGNVMAMDSLRETFDTLVKEKIAMSMSQGLDMPSSPSALNDFLKGFSNVERELLGYPPAKIDEAVAEAAQLARLGADDFVAVVGETAAKSSPFYKRFSAAFANKDNINENLEKLISVASAETASTGSMENLRKGFFDYLISEDSGVLIFNNKNTPFQDANTYDINPTRLVEIINLAQEGAPQLQRILTPEDFAVLDMLSTYTMTINKQAADAGTALSGAQLISNIFTTDPQKFVGALARMAAQQRVSKIFTSEAVVEKALALGAKDPGMLSTIKTYFTGKAAIGATLANIAVNPEPEDEQTARMLDANVEEIPDVEDIFLD